MALGRDFTLDDLFARGYRAVFLALGAHRSRRLGIEGENLQGVYPAIEFLKEFNLRGQRLAKGRVGVIGGGNSAVDAARMALRQEGVEGVAIFYRRTRAEMPALVEEVNAALEEGVRIKTLVSPVRILSSGERVCGIECLRNEPGKMERGGRRTPVPLPGTEFQAPLDTLIVTIGDEPDIDYISAMGVEIAGDGRLRVDSETLAASRPGVFAGGDVVTGPNTVVDAIAHGKRAAAMIARYLRGEPLKQTWRARRPEVYVEPVAASAGGRAEPPTLPLALRQRVFAEVELPLSEEEARREASRCLRCDLEFTRPARKREEAALTGASA
jgi:NADH-quinone oxidoreductase subunit F